MAKSLSWILFHFLFVFVSKYGLCNSLDGLSVLQRECPEGTFGFRCNFQCRCARDRPCDKETGDCPNGCADGFWGPGCQLANACFYNGKARNYMGTKSVTKQLYMCQRWDSQEPHRHSYNVREFPDEQMPENYCRTTTDSARPWCYTTSKQLRWEHCDTNNCNCPSGRFGNNCMKECHCLDSNEACDSILGICSSGCAQGWDGFDCQTAVACPANRYGWDCSKACYCNSPHHCKRFTGPNSDCRCMEGYFNAPRCQPVTPPKIVVFDNIRVNPGQPAMFNCTVSAFPTPLETEIQLYGPTKRRITLLRSTTGSDTLDTRINIFRVEYVNREERYSCVVRATAGEASRTVIANVYDLPRLIQPPYLTEDGIGVNELTIQWKPWARERGDTGDPPILWYNIWIQKFGEKSDKMVGIVTYFNCTHICKYTVTDLDANTEYGIQIATRRNGKGGDGPLGPLLYAKTACTAPNEAPVIDSLRSEFEYNSSFPQTQLIIFWKDPPNITWNCNNISAYHIHLTNTKLPSAAKAIHLPGDTPGDGSGMKSVSISDLKPSTRYCIRINFQNDVLLYSPNSLSKCTETPDTTPTFPRNLKLVTRTNTSLTISWDIPNAEEEVIKYHLAYWKGYWAELATKKGVEIMSTAPHMQYVIENLEPYTKYYIQIQGINSAGPGELTEALPVMTDEGVPGRIAKFRNTSKTSSSIILEWGEPEFTNGELQFFTVSCRPIQSLLPGPNNNYMSTLSPRSHVHTFHELNPATKYHCSVNASTSKGSGPSTTLQVWTLPPEQIDLSNPEIKDKSDSTVTLELKPLDDKAVSYYRIIVYKLGFISKRSIPDSIRDVQIDFQTAEEERSRAYVAAQIDRTYSDKEFVVGDNKTYNGYYNAPLSPKYQYEIWFAAYSVVDGNLRKSFAKAERSVAAGDRSVAEAPENSHIPVIIGVLVVFIMLILVFALLLFVWRRRHLASEREKADMPNFGPTIIPEPDTSLPSTPVDDLEIEPLIETCTSIENESEPIYGNVGVCIIPPVRVEDLWDYVKLNKENSMEGLRKEYRLIPAGLTATSEVAKKCENKSKNRYGNIIAYDHTRVILEPVDDDIHDDYTNANYIDGYKKGKAYIAAQGPTKPTINDIWRMVWQENSKTIIMLTNPTETGKKKCEQYWPNEDQIVYAGINVELVDTDNLPDFSIRTFLLTKGDESKTVKQFHYTTWPDHGVPRFGNSLLLLRQKIRTHDNLESGPPIVHCSAGVGRTGTYIAIDVNLEQAKNEGLIDVHNFVQLMRTQRVNMVQTLEQYIFVYDVLLEALICGDTTIPADKYPDALSELLEIDQNIGKTKLEEQFEVLRLISATIEKDDTSSGLRPENIFKNRCKNIIPANRCRPYLMTPVDEYNDYINAVFLNGYRRKDAFIVTQMPLPNTVVDFWRLIYDHNSYCIVMLNEMSGKDETCGIYWTLDTCGERYGPFIVETTAEIKSDPSVTVRDFTITNTLNPQEMPRVVRQFEFHRWPDSSNVPSSKVAMLELLDMVDRSQKQCGNKPVVVHCMNGASRSGLFVASSCVLERIRADREVDIFQAVKQMRLNRSQHIDNIEQFRFCHEMALEYLNTTNTMTTFS